MSAVSVRPSVAAARLEQLCDPGTLSVIRSAVESPRHADRDEARGDGIVTATGLVDGRPIVCYAQDRAFLGGSLGEVQAESVMRVLRLAGDAPCPVIGLVSSAGARMQDGTAALAGYARIFRQQVLLGGRVPQICVITGPCAGGGSYSPALADFVIMDRGASMFLTGPRVVRDVMREEVTVDELGGPGVHGRNGVCDLVGEEPEDCLRLARELLGFLPQSAAQVPPQRSSTSEPDEDPARHLPEEARRVYDVRRVVRDIVDDAQLLEVSPRWAPNMVCALTRVDGRPVAVVANQPRALGGVIDASAAQKASRFIRRADSFGLPLLVLVDTPGFLPGRNQEEAGVIRHGADLLRAFAGARVARVSVILRKAYGGAYITMNSRDLGAHLTFAWPQAEIGIMGASQAVNVVHRRELLATDDPEPLRERLADAYADRHLSVDAAAREGFVDEVIEPADTRARIISAVRTFARQSRRLGDSDLERIEGMSA